jgi:transposase
MAYDSNALRERLGERGIDLIAPDQPRRTTKVQDLRKLRRYRRRWIVERTFAWLHNFRRLVVRWDRHLTMYAAFFHVALIVVVLRKLRL